MNRAGRPLRDLSESGRADAPGSARRGRSVGVAREAPPRRALLAGPLSGGRGADTPDPDAYVFGVAAGRRPAARQVSRAVRWFCSAVVSSAATAGSPSLPADLDVADIGRCRGRRLVGGGQRLGDVARNRPSRPGVFCVPAMCVGRSTCWSHRPTEAAARRSRSRGLPGMARIQLADVLGERPARSAPAASTAYPLPIPRAGLISRSTAAAGAAGSPGHRRRRCRRGARSPSGPRWRRFACAPPMPATPSARCRSPIRRFPGQPPGHLGNAVGGQRRVRVATVSPGSVTVRW